jgi:hypothetical protein
MRVTMKSTYALILSICILSQVACGGGFAGSLRTILAASGPLIESLNLGDKKAAVIKDFTDLADGAASLKENLDACNDKLCKLGAVEVYQQVFADVGLRGHLGSVEKLRKIQTIIAGIIASARIFYGGGGESAASAPVSEQSIDVQLKALKREMEVR